MAKSQMINLFNGQNEAERKSTGLSFSTIKTVMEFHLQKPTCHLNDLQV